MAVRRNLRKSSESSFAPWYSADVRSQCDHATETPQKSSVKLYTKSCRKSGCACQCDRTLIIRARSHWDKFWSFRKSGSGTSASAETSISASQIFWERNLCFGVFAFAEIFSFDIFLAESLEKVVVSVLFFLTSVIVVNFGKFWVMRWTIENEELPLSLYFEVKARYEKKMKKDVKRCKWIAGKLQDEAKLDYSTWSS